MGAVAFDTLHAGPEVHARLVLDRLSFMTVLATQDHAFDAPAGGTVRAFTELNVTVHASDLSVSTGIVSREVESSYPCSCKANLSVTVKACDGILQALPLRIIVRLSVSWRSD